MTISNMPTVAFMGLTHLGQVTAIASAAKGVKTIGYDTDREIVDLLSGGKSNINEPQLTELLHDNKERLTFTYNPSELKSADIIYISTDVPTDANGKSDLSSVSRLVKTAKDTIGDDKLLVILCQVPPSYTRSIDWDFNNLYYQVETLIFGCALDRALNPERFIIGCHNPLSLLPEQFKNYLSLYDCPILPMKYESAELAKIAINMFLISTVSTTNTLAEVCEQIGASWQEIAPALRLDRRIGAYAYLKPGLGIAGGNLERDIRTILDLGEKKETETGVVQSWLTNSAHRRDWINRVINKLLSTNNISYESRICILGISYKENTHSVKNAISLNLFNSLRQFNINTYDPAAKVDLSPFTNITRLSSKEDALKGAVILIILTPWDEFKDLNFDTVASLMTGKIIIDPYQVLIKQDFINNNFKYFTLGEKTWN